jgi:hypothetical protein
MDDNNGDLSRTMLLDGNAVAGLLREVFALEMTANPAKCAHCGAVGALGTLLAFTKAPGVVLRCPACEQVMLRIVETPEAIYLEARGAAYLRFERRAS